MAKFKQVPQTFLLKKLLGFWGNMVENYSSDVQDDDFFDIVRNCFDHDKAVELIIRHQGERSPFEVGR